MRQRVQVHAPISGFPSNQYRLSNSITLSSIYTLNQASAMTSFDVCIMANRQNGTWYAGSISALMKRVWAHKNNIVLGFTAKYKIHKLVYYQERETYVEAARCRRT